MQRGKELLRHCPRLCRGVEDLRSMDATLDQALHPLRLALYHRRRTSPPLPTIRRALSNPLVRVSQLEERRHHPPLRGALHHHARLVSSPVLPPTRLRRPAHSLQMLNSPLPRARRSFCPSFRASTTRSPTRARSRLRSRIRCGAVILCFRRCSAAVVCLKRRSIERFERRGPFGRRG